MGKSPGWIGSDSGTRKLQLHRIWFRPNKRMDDIHLLGGSSYLDCLNGYKPSSKWAKPAYFVTGFGSQPTFTITRWNNKICKMNHQVCHTHTYSHLHIIVVLVAEPLNPSDSHVPPHSWQPSSICNKAALKRARLTSKRLHPVAAMMAMARLHGPEWPPLNPKSQFGTRMAQLVYMLMLTMAQCYGHLLSSFEGTWGPVWPILAPINGFSPSKLRRIVADRQVPKYPRWLIPLKKMNLAHGGDFQQTCIQMIEIPKSFASIYIPYTTYIHIYREYRYTYPSATNVLHVI